MLEGKFISFEGGEGVGKTTQITLLRETLESLGHQIVVTREPGGTVVAEAIRSLVLSKALPAMCPDTELMLVFAARLEHVQTLIKPSLASGKTVLCDRFVDSSIAYQGYGRGVSLERIRALNQWVLGDFEPDVTLYFDLPISEGLARAGKRAELDRFEQEGRSFFESVRSGYQTLATECPHRYRSVDASGSVLEVAAKVRAALGIAV